MACLILAKLYYIGLCYLRSQLSTISHLWSKFETTISQPAISCMTALCHICSPWQSFSAAYTDYGYDVEYTRVPVTDEKAPKEKDFALLMRRLWKPPEDAALIFNCQMGRGRTSTGMIIASLLRLRRHAHGVTMPTQPQGKLLYAVQKQ